MTRHCFLAPLFGCTHLAEKACFMNKRYPTCCDWRPLPALLCICALLLSFSPLLPTATTYPTYHARALPVSHHPPWAKKNFLPCPRMTFVHLPCAQPLFPSYSFQACTPLLWYGSVGSLSLPSSPFPTWQACFVFLHSPLPAFVHITFILDIYAFPSYFLPYIAPTTHTLS